VARKIRVLPVIGWREWVRLPDLGIEAIKAKVDTGARTSSLHAFNLREFDRDGVRFVRFVVHPAQKSTRGSVTVVAQVVEHRVVRNPGGGGREETRPVIATDVEIGDRRWPIEITLTSRDEMGFRMLLGRQALRRRFVVDAGRSFITGKGNA
jgi:hypothetical protein